MIDKKQTGGLGEDNEDLIQPGDQELNTNNLINTVENRKPIVSTGLGGSDILRNMQDYGFRNSGSSVNRINTNQWNEYNRLIDGKFSLNDSNIDDKRAAGQGFGEKALHGFAKFFPKTGAHILGSTYGLLDGFGEVATDAYENGFAASNWNKFFNNDFQRSLDAFNESVDEKLPHYYSSQERDLSFSQSVFGAGAANFWTNDFSNGLSFVAGAVLSEYLTAGAATLMIPARAANKLKGIAAIRNTTYGQKAISASKNLQRINRAERIYDGLTTGRRLLTGAFYESGVEARHNYDQTVNRLNELHVEKTGEAPTPEDQAKIKDVAIKVSNGVFAGNAALVGYSNMLMFSRIFGSGLTKNKRFKNKIIKDPKTGVYKARHKDWGRMRTMAHKYGWIARRPLYEGFVEEGGQKTLDIAGQYAAEDMYLNDKNPGQMEAIGEILNHTYKGMEEAYGSTEGQKEIFLGMVLAALGLPSFIQTNEKGEKSFGIGYGKTGGIKDFMGQYAEGRKEIEDLVEYMNENPDAMAGIKNNFDMLMGIKTADDARDYADATNNDFAYKNADHDAFFSFVFSRLKGGYFGDVMDSLEDIRDMDLDAFETMFNYEEQTQEMSKQDREAFLSERRNTVIDTHKERANKIKEIYTSLDRTKLSSKAKKIYSQALSTTADLDAREAKLISEIEETGGFALTAIVNKQESDKDSHDNVFGKVKNFVMKKLGRKGKDVMENSEVGKEVKREIGIKEFTEPGHPALVFMRMNDRLQQLKKQRDAYEQDDNAEGYVETDDKVIALEEEMAILAEAINNQTAPNISEEEQQILDEYKQKDPAGYELNKDDIIKKLQDLRRIRAKRHQMLNLIQQMIDPAAAEDVIQEFEEVAQDMLTEEERKSLPPEEQRLARKYKGKIIEFDYTNKKGETKRHRVYFKDAGNKGLVRLPNEETFKLLQRKKALLDKAVQTEDDLIEIDLINEELKRNEHVTKHDTYEASILNNSSNIKVMNEQELLLNQLQAVTSVLQDNLAENLASATSQIVESKEKILLAAQQIKDIKVAIQQAKRSKRGALYVNLNAIGRKGNFSVQSAYQLLSELKIEEANYKVLLEQFTKDINTLEDNSLRIQLIHTVLTNPDIVSDILKKSTTRKDVFEFLNDTLGLTSIEEFYKNLGEKGFFDTNELTKIAGQKNKDGGYDVDMDILQEILALSGTNISKDYLDLMSSDLTHFRNELELLTKHRSDVERMLDKMVNPQTKEVLLFPPDGLTQEDLAYLTAQLRMVDQDIKTIQGIINMMEAEVDQALSDAVNSDLIQERLKAIAVQAEINDVFIELENWINSITVEPAEPADLEDGETILTLEDINDLESQRDSSPSLSNVGWTKTAGNHGAALRKWRTIYRPLVESGATLTEAEQMELQHIKSQLRFFRKSYDIFNYAGPKAKKPGARLMVVTRHNIRPEWKDKFVFYDIAKAQKSGKPDDSSNYQYVDNLTENLDNNETLEDIKLLLVDANNNPILVDGEFAYTDMNSSDINTSKGRFKGQEAEDLNEDGSLKEGLLEAQESFKALRISLLADNQERFLRITRKSRGLVIKNEETDLNGNPIGLTPGLGKLRIKKRNGIFVAKEEDLKDMRLNLALPAKGTKGAHQILELFGFRVKSRFAYFGTNNKGDLGTNNLIPAIVSRLSEGRINNIYNLSRYFAENEEGGGISIGGKGFETILKDQLLYGDRSKERERQEFSIYMQEDAIHFGDQGQSITLEQLKNPEQYSVEHQAYKDFLSTLFFNINSTILNADKTAREDAYKTGEKTGKWTDPAYTKFNEVIINDDLSTDVIEWDNYTHYLLSDVNRESEDVPVRVDMNQASNNAPGLEQALIPQFMNVYFEHSNFAETAEGLSNKTNDANRQAPSKTEEAPVVKTEETEDLYEERVVVNSKTGERRTVLVRVASEKEKSIIEAETTKDIEETPQIEDTLEGSPFSQSTDNSPDEPYFLANMVDTSSQELDLNSEIEWFNANMPKDSKGNPLFTIDLIKGLIDGKAYGKFTKDSKILLSDLMTVPGILYHESWHAITRVLLTPEQRSELYDEVKLMGGKATTYKGETKELIDFTDKEADEWLAEEFREYVLAKGSYKVGEKIQRNLWEKLEHFTDRIFEYIFNALNLFVNRRNVAQRLMSKINSGYFANPNREFTVYDNKTEAYYEATELTATMRNNTMEGMTVILFNKALDSNAFSLEDFTTSEGMKKVNAAAQSIYGKAETPGSVYSQIEFYIKENLDRASTEEDKANLEKTMYAIRDNWDQLKEEHSQYLERFNIEISEELEEIERIREQFGKPQNEIDPSVYLPKAVRILLGTLPRTENGKFVVNESGLPKLVDFGSIMNFMYREFANTNPLDFTKTLKSLESKRPEIKSIINRLGLESDDLSTKTSDQMRLIIQTMMQFDQSNNTFYTQLMTRDGGRQLINSNQNRVEDKIKLLWTNNFKDRIQDNKGLGEDINGELILNKDAKVKVGRKKKTFAEWATDPRKTPVEVLAVLDQLGITFTDAELFADLYVIDNSIREAVNFIFQAVYNEPVSNIFKGDIQSNLKTLVNLEAKTNPLAVDLQHRSPEGKTIHGVNLKTYADVLISNLSTLYNGNKIVNTEFVESLLKYDNLNGSYYLRSMLQDLATPLEVVVLEGIDKNFGQGKPLSKSTPADIGVMMVNSILGKGIVPILRTADKKTEFGFKWGQPTLAVSENEMLERLQRYLADELRVASKFNSKRKSKLHRVSKLKDEGGNLRFFKGLVPSINRNTYGKLLSEEQIQEIVSRDSVIEDLQQFLSNEVNQTIQTLSTYNIALEGIDKNLLDNATIQAVNNNIQPVEVLGMQFTYEYMTNVIEQGKLLLGDFALYEDLFKRTSGISGAKTYATSDPNILEWMNEEMPNLLSNKEHSNSLRVSHRAAIKTEAPYLDQYIDTLIALGAPQSFIQNVSDVYSDMEEFDGGGFITFDAYRSLMYRVGKWSPTQEAFYQKVAEGKEITSEDIAIIPPIKPQLFGPFIMDNSRLMTFHKFALFPIIPGMTIGKAFDDINQDMINNNIDYMIFESAVKVGGITAGQEFVDKVNNPEGYDPFYQEIETGYNMYKPMALDDQEQPLGLQELSFSDLGIQVEMAPKTEEEVTEGSQLRSLLPVNIYDNGELSEEYKEFEDLIDRYHEINNILVEKDFNNLIKKLKLTKDSSGIYKLDSENLDEFKKALIKEFKKRDNPLHTIAAIEELLDSDTKFIEQLFEKNKIENLLYSLVNNNVVKRKMPGGQFVLQASTGFEDKVKAIKQNDFDKAKKEGIDLHDAQLKPLKFYRRKDPNNPNSEVLAMQVYLPSRFRDKMGIIEDVNDPNLDPDLLQLIGFRIPTEGLNSMDFIEVVGFLPKSFGDTVIVPSEIVGKAGSDYDIDKLSIYFPNSYMDGDVLRRIKFNEEKSLKQQSTKALQNEIQTIIRDVLSHPASFDQLISPVGAWKLKDLATEVAMLRNPSDFDAEGNKIKLPLHKTLNLENMINTSYRMFSGLGGIGIVATSSTQHAKGQRPGINWNYSNNEDIVFNFEGEGFGLSRVYDVKGNKNGDKISGTIGQYVTGYVDVTKADFVFDINAGIEYAPIHMLLVRSGVPLEQVVYFMSQPIIDDYVKEKEINQPMYTQFPIKSNNDIFNELSVKYGKKSTNAKLNSTLLKSMIGKSIEELTPVQQQVQVQVLNDFLRYKDLAEDLLMLKNASSVDTTNLNNGMAVRYAKQAINRLEQDGKFINLDELLYGNKEGPSTIAAYTTLLNDVDGMFAEFKLGEYILDAKQFTDNKLFESTDKDLKMFKDDVLYKMQKFENFLATTVVQNTSYEYNKLHERGKSLFIGKDSLPRRINNLKKIGKYKNNLLIQELTPILQVYTENSAEGTVDGLRLFSKKLQPYDIDLLSDAFMELKEVNPELAEDLIIFSALQSGYSFSPSSFFQVIPGTEVLSVLSKYFKQNKNKDRTSNLINKNNMSSLWTDFHKNYSDDQRITPNMYRRSANNTEALKRNDDFVSITTKVGQQTVGGKQISMYNTDLYKNTGTVTDKGLTIYTKIDKKGVKNSFIEATGAEVPSLVNRNLDVIVPTDVTAEPEIANTILTVERNMNNEIQNVLTEEDQGCKTK